MFKGVFTQVLARISLLSDAEFKRVLDAILQLFSEDRRLLELRGSLIIRNLCVLLNAKSIYISLATILQSPVHDYVAGSENLALVDVPAIPTIRLSEDQLDFRSIMVQTLNLILLTARELDELRLLLRSSLESGASKEATAVFVTLFGCWCHNPVATLALCLIAQAYELSSALVTLFANVDITVGFLMQVDKLVQLLESPVFIQLRLQLLEVHTSYHPFLLKSLYGLLMLLPQSAAFTILSNRLATISTLQFHLGSSVSAKPLASTPEVHSRLLSSFKEVQEAHANAHRHSAVGRSLDGAQ